MSQQNHQSRSTQIQIPLSHNSNEIIPGLNVNHILTSVHENKSFLQKILPMISFVANELGYSDTRTTTPVATETINVMGYPEEEETEAPTAPLAIPNEPARDVSSYVQTPIHVKVEPEESEWPMEEDIDKYYPEHQSEKVPEFPIRSLELFNEMENLMGTDEQYSMKVVSVLENVLRNQRIIIMSSNLEKTSYGTKI